jgi:hypothetical protein
MSVQKMTSQDALGTFTSQLAIQSGYFFNIIKAGQFFQNASNLANKNLYILDIQANYILICRQEV